MTRSRKAHPSYAYTVEVLLSPLGLVYFYSLRGGLKREGMGYIRVGELINNSR